MNGLEGVVAAETVLSEVDGEAGRLTLRGYLLDDLAGWRAEDAFHLLMAGFVPDLPPAGEFAGALGAARARVFARLAAAPDLPADPVQAMRALTATLEDGEGADVALALLAAPAVFAPAVLRRRAGLAPVAPDPGLAHAADVLRMLTGTRAPDATAAALDTYLVAVVDHGLNASTFAARVVASTRAGLTSAVLAGLGALKGPLHGGAPGPVIAMLDAIGTPERAPAWIEETLAAGKRLMGFGHRVYRVRDPRADALKAALRRLPGAGDRQRLVLAEAVEVAALAALKRHKPGRKIETNVEFYTALLLEALDFPPDAFTCVFAMGRTAGWIAHAGEQIASGRLIRPLSVYVGPRPEEAA